MNALPSHKSSSSFLFQVEILVNAETNGEALEKMLHVLNAGNFADYRITSGIKLGQAIEAALQQAGRQEQLQIGQTASPQAGKTASSPPSPKPASSSSVKAKISAALAKSQETAAKSSASGTSQAKKKSEENIALSDELQERIRSYISSNKLIRLNVNKGRGVKLSIPCRIISLDAERQMLTVYHVDEKQVHSLKLFEIDDFIE